MPKYKHPVEDIVHIITYEEWKSKTKNKHRETELMFSLPQKKICLSHAFISMLKLWEEFPYLLWLHLKSNSDLFFLLVVAFFLSPECVPPKGTGNSQCCYNSSHTFLKLQRLVVMASGGQLSKDQRFGMVRIIIEKPECCNARSSWGHQDIRQGLEQEKSLVSLVLEIPWEQFSCGISALCHTKIKICRNASILLFFPPLKYTKIIKTQS